MHQPQQRHLSTYPALLEPTCRRRLPMPPDTHLRRSSSPRILPTPPPLSPEYRCPSAAPHLERRPSGRQLPRPPTAELSNLTSLAHNGPGNSQCSLSPVSLTPDPTPDEPEFYEEEDVDESEVVEEDYAQEEEEEGDDGEVVEYEDPVVVTPPEEIRRISPEILIAPPPQPRRMSKFSVHSPSIEQITSKSSSDTEDPIAHGLDPSLYSPNAPIIIENNNTAIHKTSVASSSSPTPQQPRGLGLLHCSLLYFAVRKRLRVTVTKIEALAGELKPEMEIHALCKVSIPGLKGGKEQTSETKRGRDPLFNHEFFFDNVTHEELDTKVVIITACHAGGGIKGKEIVIGEASVPLRDIREMNTKKEIKFIEEIKGLVPKKLGKIYTSSIIEKDSKRLTINLKKVDALPKCGLIGAPDVCVKITLTQGAKTQTKSSRVIKNTCSAVYNEAVMFLCGTSKNDLAQTSIVISVHDAQRTCTGDDTIGCAYLGIGAVDKSEIDQWKGTTEHLGKEYKGNHTLKAPITAPPVHVAEANDDVAADDDD
ncbi:C2 domain-containing protein [Caenorhabditis elegans]|uniref:C2 domain-containing protein n=1 Tax=Caenorhabditis elegans TaxID=6239 RepID=Q19136_CAEEL|nr:C2 domain-containing protein [Caenorhabditis elegans]CAA96615.2 C2 domain-containing protein [Caenorhabditis elegans]|eukprot:NP_492083.2 SUppressor of Elongation defect [Caenorhabditis elegans]